MATPEPERPGLLVEAALVGAVVAVGWLQNSVMFATVVVSFAATTEAFGAGGVIWPPVGVVVVAGAATALFGPLLRRWSALRVWLTMLTALAFALSVLLVLAPP